MGKSQSKLDDRRNKKKITTRRLKLGVKFGKDADGGVEAGLACGYEKKVDCDYGSNQALLKEQEE